MVAPLSFHFKESISKSVIADWQSIGFGK